MRQLKVEIRQKKNKWWGVRLAWKGWGPDLVLDRDYNGRSRAVRAGRNLVKKLGVEVETICVYTSSGKLCAIVSLRGS